MVGKISGVLLVISFVFSFVNGTTAETAAAALDGASGAIGLILSLAGMMCLWCGVMRVFEEVGALDFLCRILSPLMRVLFPDAYRKGHGTREIAASFAANILGIGNAATPLSLAAMRALGENAGPSDAASDDMVTFTVISTACFSIMPTTVIALRRAAGSVDPFGVVVPIWICSFACCVFGAFLSRGLRKFGRRGK